MIEACGRLPGPTKIWVHNPKLAKVAGLGAHFQPGHYSRPSVSARSPSASSPATGIRLSNGRARTAREGSRAAGAPVEALIGGLPVTFEDGREQVAHETAMVPQRALGAARAA